MDFFFVICFFLCYTVMSVSGGLVVNCLEGADLLAFLCAMFSCIFCYFPIWCPGSGVVRDYINS